MPIPKVSPIGPEFEAFVEQAQRTHPSKSKTEILRILQDRIRSYEKKYGMSSEEFIRRYEEGDFEMDDHYPDQDLFRWWSYCRGYRKHIESESER